MCVLKVCMCLDVCIKGVYVYTCVYSCAKRALPWDLYTRVWCSNWRRIKRKIRIGLLLRSRYVCVLMCVCMYVCMCIRVLDVLCNGFFIFLFVYTCII